jgi:nucleotidyltransferase substrate binding protein (TIGR01987 family)
MQNAEKHPRWMERLSVYGKVLDRLGDVVQMSRRCTLNEYERDCLIKRFEFSYEMAWKLMMSYEKDNGIDQLLGPRDVIRRAVSMSLIDNGEAWMDMIDVRNRTSHDYDEETAVDVTDDIIYTHYPLLTELRDKMAAIANSNE